MTLAGMLAQKYWGAPLALWLLGLGAGFYVLMHKLEHDSWSPAPLQALADALPSGGATGIGSVPRGQVYMPEFPMPEVIQYPDYGTNYGGNAYAAS